MRTPSLLVCIRWTHSCLTCPTPYNRQHCGQSNTNMQSPASKPSRSFAPYDVVSSDTNPCRTGSLRESSAGKCCLSHCIVNRRQDCYQMRVKSITTFGPATHNTSLLLISAIIAIVDQPLKDPCLLVHVSESMKQYSVKPRSGQAAAAQLRG